MSDTTTRALAVADVLPDSKLELLRHTYGVGLSDAEFDLFVQASRRLGLDPFAGQVHAAKRKGRLTIMTSIDGFRSKGEETGEYEGQPPVLWCGPDGAWVDVWLGDKKPVAARAGIYRHGFREAIVAVARMDAYDQGNGWWTTAGGAAHMLAKCAEALAWRKAFPRQLGGLYTKDEMGQEAKAEPARARVETTQANDRASTPEVQGTWEEQPEPAKPAEQAPPPAKIDQAHAFAWRRLVAELGPRDAEGFWVDEGMPGARAAITEKARAYPRLREITRSCRARAVIRAANAVRDLRKEPPVDLPKVGDPAAAEVAESVWRALGELADIEVSVCGDLRGPGRDKQTRFTLEEGVPLTNERVLAWLKATTKPLGFRLVGDGPVRLADTRVEWTWVEHKD